MSPPNIMPETTLKHRSLQDDSTADQDLIIEQDWQLPEFSIKEIRDHIPNELFNRDLWQSSYWVLHDIAIVGALFYAATYIDILPAKLQWIAWPVYWFAQSVVATGIWVLGHECGHQAFSDYRVVNNAVGWVLHSFLLVPFHSWRLSHSMHHKKTGHIEQDEVFMPKTRSMIGMPKREEDPEGDGPHSMFEDAPLYAVFNLCLKLYFGWPMYLIFNSTGPLNKRKEKNLSHFNPKTSIYEPRHFWDIIVSDLGIALMLGVLVYTAKMTSTWDVIRYYALPYSFVNCWLVLITYLQHTDPALPHYSAKVWNFQRGAALTIDRPYGFGIDYFQHHIADSHVAHHFFSTMPHYNAVKATHYIKKALGSHYQRDDTFIPVAAYRAQTMCRYIEDEGDVLFFKH
ncbi:delta-12-fatty acid desaturase [Umbelopsis sp. PMI_123]|nr:delta-12-fatty acid desaturase [Umbelopsis sp. PMI_123]